MGRMSERVGFVLGLAVVGVGGLLGGELPPVMPDRKPAAAAAPKTGALVFEKTEISFDDITDEKPVEMMFPFTNTGDQAITIRRMTAHCGCTTPELEKKTYEAGESGAIKVIFDPHRRYGKQAKQVTVYTDDPVRPIKILMVRGYVRAIVYVEPFLTNFGQVSKGETGSKVMYVIGEKEGFEITEIVSTNPEVIGAEIVGSTPVDKDGLEMVKYTIRVDLLGAKRSGRYAEQLVFKTNDPRRPEIDANVLVRVPSELMLGRPMVRVGKIAVGDSFEKEMLLKHERDVPFKILKIESESKLLDLAFEWDNPEDPGQAHTIVVKGSAVAGGGAIPDKIIVTTDLDDEEPVTMHFKGIVVDPAKAKKRAEAAGKRSTGGVVEIED